MAIRKKRWYGYFAPFRTTELHRGWVLASTGRSALAKFMGKFSGEGILSLPSEKTGEIEVNKGEYGLGYDGDYWVVAEGKYPEWDEDLQGGPIG